jgi:hypothetical protein
VSAFHVTWDSHRPPGQRILDISLERPDSSSENGLERMKREPGEVYRIITREYMAQVGLCRRLSAKIVYSVCYGCRVTMGLRRLKDQLI